MINWIRNRLFMKLDERARRNASMVARALVSTLFADISVETLESLIVKAKENRKKTGHSDYSSLADLYCSIMSERAASPNEEKE